MLFRRDRWCPGSSAARLKPGGLFVLSIEETAAAQAPRGWTLGSRGRYTHTESHLLAAAQAAGSNVLAMQPESVRNEAEIPVPGRLAVLQRPDHAH